MIHYEFISGWKNVKKVNVPTLIMWGSNDKWIPLEIAWRFENDIKNSNVIIYEGAGHIPMEEIPVKTARDADRFFNL
jgi:pimeloyl-ACP methyl ester carboxylesterase